MPEFVSSPLSFSWRSQSARRGFPAVVVGLLAVLTLVATSTISAQPAVPLHTSGRFIVDSNGTRVHLNAFNWYGFDGADFVVEGLEAQPLASIVSTIKGMGFNAVRLPWSNQMVESNPVVGNYALTANASLEGEHALSIFDTVVNALTSAGIMVILDNHMSNAGWCCSTTDNNELWYNSDYPQANWIADWQAMAQRYASNPMVIGVDLRNEPRSPATWGGSVSTDWHAAAQTGGNAVLAVNPNLLIFVEGISYAGDLSGVATLPVQLNVANQLVYEAHDYGFWYSNGFTSYNNYVNTITPKWGYLITGANPQPLWIGEFGTCNSTITCVSSNNATDYGYWFQAMSSFVEQYGVDWSYWAINGTTESGNGGGFGTVEGYGVLNTSWNASALPALTSRLESMMATGATFNLVPDSSITLVPGAVGNPNVTIVPVGGFSGTVNLSCSVSGPSGAIDLPQCSVPSSVTLSGNATASVPVSITTTGAMARNALPGSSTPRGNGARTTAFALAGAFLLLGTARRWRSSFLLLMVILASSFAMAACGGGSSNGGSAGTVSGTTAGSYAVTVTASASGVSSVSTQIGLTVQ
jgi:endoglucanase